MLLNKAILGLAKLAPEEEGRYCMQAVSVEHGCSTVTNGHYLVNVTSGELAHSEVDFPVIPAEHKKLAGSEALLVSKSAALAALKAIKALGKKCLPILANAALTTENKLVVNSLDTVQSFNSTAEGTYPSWRRIIQTGKPLAEIAVSADYLQKLAAYVSEHADERNPAIRLTIYDSATALRFDARTADGQDVMALLMPMRMDSCTFANRPDQMPAEVEQAA